MVVDPEVTAFDQEVELFPWTAAHVAATASTELGVDPATEALDLPFFDLLTSLNAMDIQLLFKLLNIKVLVACFLKICLEVLMIPEVEVPIGFLEF